MKLTASTRTMLLCMILLVFPSSISAEPFVFQEKAPPEPKEEPQTKFSISAKGGVHLFWATGAFVEGEKYGRPELSTWDMVGPLFELDADYNWRPHVVFSATAGAYHGESSDENIELLGVYGLVTAKLVRVTTYADYYTGLGVGIYSGHIDADDTASALKGGFHALVGVRIPITGKWALTIENRAAFSQKAKGGFKDINLGGNFSTLGCSYRF